LAVAQPHDGQAATNKPEIAALLSDARVRPLPRRAQRSATVDIGETVQLSANDGGSGSRWRLRASGGSFPDRLSKMVTEVYREP